MAWTAGCAALHLGFYESVRPGEPIYEDACDCSLSVPSREWVRDVPAAPGNVLDVAHRSGDVKIGVRVFRGAIPLEVLADDALQDHRELIPNAASSTGGFSFRTPELPAPAVVVHSCGVMLGWEAWAEEQCLVSVFTAWSDRVYEISVLDVGVPLRSAEIDEILRSFRLGRPGDPPRAEPPP